MGNPKAHVLSVQSQRLSALGTRSNSTRLELQLRFELQSFPALSPSFEHRGCKLHLREQKTSQPLPAPLHLGCVEGLQVRHLRADPDVVAQPLSRVFSSCSELTAVTFTMVPPPGGPSVGWSCWVLLMSRRPLQAEVRGHRSAAWGPAAPHPGPRSQAVCIRHGPARAESHRSVNVSG